MKSSPEPSTMECKEKGFIHSIESFGTVDGPGIRLVVFFQGCPMRCLYCHNPDTWAPKKGEAMTVEEILKLYEKNKRFYQKGGITATGGEPLMQLPFLTSLFQAAREKGIHTCLDTSGILYLESHLWDYQRLLKNTSLVLLDIKHSLPKGHLALTSQEQEPVLAFLRLTEKMQVPLVIRHVIVKGYTDSREELEEVGKILASHTNICGLEVLPYHSMGEKKYRELGISYPLEGMKSLPKEEAQKARQIILESRKHHLSCSRISSKMS